MMTPRKKQPTCPVCHCQGSPPGKISGGEAWASLVATLKASALLVAPLVADKLNEALTQHATTDHGQNLGATGFLVLLAVLWNTFRAALTVAKDTRKADSK